MRSPGIGWQHSASLKATPGVRPLIEMAVRCGVRNRMLALVGGAFSERFASIGAACGREVVRLDVQWGKTVEPDMLRDAIKGA